jgi:hypothetical protein
MALMSDLLAEVNSEIVFILDESAEPRRTVPMWLFSEVLNKQA